MIENAVVFLLVVFAGALMAIVCFVVGAWVMFKGKAGPGEGFIRTPNGQVFSIPDADAEDFPDDDKKVVAERTERFLSSILGGGK